MKVIPQNSKEASKRKDSRQKRKMPVRSAKIPVGNERCRSEAQRFPSERGDPIGQLLIFSPKKRKEKAASIAFGRAGEKGASIQRVQPLLKVFFNF